MTGLAIRFTAGRFHATPWGRHVNEGVPEWPPSPWRLLRSLVATWKRKLDGRWTEAEVAELIRRLADVPEFVLPPATVGHTRHYVPLGKGADDRTLVFDTFVALERDAELAILWPSVTLPPPLRAALAVLAEHLQFLGRAESWCDTRVLDDEEVAALRQVVNCRPTDGDAPSAQELVRVLCADPERALANDLFSHTVEHRRGRTTSATVEKTVTYDPDWHLCAETLWIHGERWSDPPGARWVSYTRPTRCFASEPSPPIRPVRATPQVARFALDSSVLPLVADTLPVAEAARRALMCLQGRITTTPDGARGRSDVLSGKDEAARPLEGHRHAFYLPTDEDGDGKLDHLTVVAEGGFGEAEVRAIDRLRELRVRSRDAETHPLRVLLLGLGRWDEDRPIPGGPLGPSVMWTSATPFLVTRHLKTRGRKRDGEDLRRSPAEFVMAVLREELARLIERRADLADLDPAAIAIAPLVDETGVFRLGARQLRPIQFRRFREKRGDDGGRRPTGAFTLTFPRPVRGPIALGHSSHFGMGLFLP
jgi:CRISPR-associated protein Csb2